MTRKTKAENRSGVDKTLVSMFLKMTPEERLRANDQAACMILELKNAYQQRKFNRRKSKLNT